MDASAPGPLRLAGFLLSIGGALVIGLGAVATWVTVGVRAVATNTDTAIPGTDLPDGTTAFVCAVLVLVGILGSRFVRSSRAAVILSAIAITAATIALATGGAFLLTGRDRSAVLDTLAIPPELWEEVGAFRDIGPGPALVMVGGALAFVGGVLTLAWSLRRGAPQGPDAPD
jgi:hypothetical protein